MTTSIETKRQMKKWEGLRLFAYLDTGGVPTIGFGHTKGVRMGDAITLKQAEQYFEQDIAIFEKEINSLGVELEQCQFDALVSFCYNIGISKFRRSTLCRYVKMGMNANYIAAEFLKWVHCRVKAAQRKTKKRRKFLFYHHLYYSIFLESFCCLLSSLSFLVGEKILYST